MQASQDAVVVSDTGESEAREKRSIVDRLLGRNKAKVVSNNITKIKIISRYFQAIGR
ncbi:MAG TPA: hypothetical protein VED16_04945 [Candidatus Acidoferrum sp.]|nr:hypothetical protein [Candidatus Acidoferrum sp.]